MEHFADRLAQAVRDKGNSLCVGLDPRWDSLPSDLRRHHAGETPEAVAAAYEEFCVRVIDLVTARVAVVKPQSAFFEACGPAGMVALVKVMRYARKVGLITIWDSKRNDIADTASAYAEAAFTGLRIDDNLHPIWNADAMTVNPYLGRDSVEPFLKCAAGAGRGVFVVVRTSNPGAKQFQDLECGGRPLFMHVADAVGTWSAENLGKCGQGAVGAVVGATYPAEMAALRALLPHVIFLVPGFGSQGGAAADTAPAFRDDGLGAVVNSSRGVIFSYPPSEGDWETRIESATDAAINSLKAATPMKLLGGPRA
jgi:orotidine-5'-phosphate decarboxylase